MNSSEPVQEDFDQDSTDTDLAILVRTLPLDQSKTYTQALQLLSSMQTSPSCNRLAASTLLSSCQDIDGTAHDAEGFLDDTKSIYAAQLAMCEISSTGLTIPSECEPLKPVIGQAEPRTLRGTSSNEKAKSGDRNSIKKPQLSQCLQSLESRPQWWTSYSNSRQNAVVMCQAARVDIGRGKTVF